MLEDVHSALIDDVITSGVSGSSNSSTVSTARAVTSSTPSTTTTHKKTKLDLLLTQLSPLFGVRLFYNVILCLPGIVAFIITIHMYRENTA